jgi:FAD/FMN-containing dehydrogenase
MTETSLPVLELDPRFMGVTIRPGDPDYDTARAVYNASIDKEPAIIARPTGVADVADAVNFARDARLPLTVRCGGHAVAGTSANEGGVLLDLSGLKGTEVNLARGTAIAQGGALWGEYDRDTAMRGVATPGGRVTSTGVGGFTLGGGYGWLSPKYGLTCDNLVGADVVTADGRLVHVSETDHPDLLWALRGAGANFGVVVNYELRVHPLPPLLLAGLLVVPNDDGAGEIVRAYRDALEQAPEEVVGGIATILAPPADFVPPELVGRPMVGFPLAYIGPTEEAIEALAPFREITAGGLDLVQPMPYTAFQAILDDFNQPGFFNYHRGLHLSGLSDTTLDRYLEVGTEIRSPMDQGVVFRHGGAVSRVPDDSSAFSHRDSAYMAHPIACWATPEETEEQLGWVARFTDAFAADRTGAVYLNFEPGTSDVHAGFGPEKYARLAELKATWDPGNLFRSNHNIEPAG